jgi:hypothetical protein
MANGIDTDAARRFGRDFGRDIFEQTRRRFASQFATQRNQRRSQFATIGGRGSSAEAAERRRLRTEESRALADASLSSQLAGTQIGQQEAERLEGIRQFGETLGFSREQLEQQGSLTREGFRLQELLQRLQGTQAMERLQAQLGFQGGQSRLGMLGNLGLGLGSLAVPGLGALQAFLSRRRRNSGGGGVQGSFDTGGETFA